MEKILQSIMDNLNLLNIQGRDAERMTAIKSMVRELIAACKNQQKGADTNDP